MNYKTTSQINDTLEGIAVILSDIADSLAHIAASMDKPGGFAEVASLSEADIASLTSVLHSDGGVDLSTTKTFRTYGDPTVLSGDEEGLK